MTTEDWILDKHISKKALPHENIISWVKWDPKLVVQNIILKYEPDVIITKALNVSDEGLKKGESYKEGEIIVEQKYLQIPGFFGFTCFFDAIPEEEKTVSFIVELHFGDTVKQVEYSTKIIRPILKFEQTEYTLTSSQFGEVAAPIDFKLVNVGSGMPINLQPFVDVLNTNNMKIQIQSKTEMIKDESLVFVKTNQITSPQIKVAGVGYGMLSMGFEYEDAMGNSYKSPLANLSISINEKQVLQVPITENISALTMPLLQAVV